MKTEQVYLIHFEQPYPGGARPQHYRGSARDAETRLAEHRKTWEKGRDGRERTPRDAALVHAMGRAGIDFRLISVEPGDRHRERLLKNRGSQRQMCPECRVADRERRSRRQRERRAERRNGDAAV